MYEAGATFLELGNIERDIEAYRLCLRRYRRASALFNRIKDRTSVAKVLVEEARTHIRAEDDPEAVRQSLHKAVCLVVAHIKNLPYGTLPNPTDEDAIRFLERKGYVKEAKAYKAAVQEGAVSTG